MGGSYEMCHLKKVTSPMASEEPSKHCSAGTRMNGGPCMMRLEELTYDEASQACADRGGRLAAPRNEKEVKELQDFADKMDFGIGLRDREADEAWKFDSTNEDANAAVATLSEVF